jgi:hypothetical protein
VRFGWEWLSDTGRPGKRILKAGRRRGLGSGGYGRRPLAFSKQATVVKPNLRGWADCGPILRLVPGRPPARLHVQGGLSFPRAGARFFWAKKNPLVKAGSVLNSASLVCCLFAAISFGRNWRASLSRPNSRSPCLATTLPGSAFGNLPDRLWARPNAHPRTHADRGQSICVDAMKSRSHLQNILPCEMSGNMCSASV